MARKSGWQQFSDNFNSVYGTFKKIGQDSETAKLMNDEEFTKKGGLGFDSITNKALTGDALETARMKALGDIYTKYGNADKGLEVRRQLAGLASDKVSNNLAQENLEVQQAIRDQLILQRGSGATGLQSAQTTNTLASAGLSDATAVDITAQTQSQVDANVALAGQRTANGKLATEQGKVVVPDSEASILLKKAQAGLADANTNDVTANADAQKAINVAADNNLKFETSINTIFTEANNNEAYKTEADAQAGILKSLREAEIPNDMRMSAIDAIQKHGVGMLQNEAAFLTQSARNAAQLGVANLVKFYDTVDDTVDGEKTSLTYEGSDEAGWTVSQVIGDNTTVLFKGKTEAEISAVIMNQIEKPGTGLGIAANVLSNETAQINNDLNLETLKGFAGERRLKTAETSLIREQTKKIRADLRAETQPLSARAREELSIKNIGKFVTSLVVSGMVEDSEDWDAAIQNYISGVANAQEGLGVNSSPITITPRL